MNHRLWKTGSRVVDTNGYFATLLAVWAEYAWIIYDGQTIPVSVVGRNLSLPFNP